MKCRVFFSTATIVVALLAIPTRLGAQSTAADHKQKNSFDSFDAPGAGTGFNEGTYALTINLFGAITGYDLDANSVYHGFLRYPNGSIVVFDAPGADTAAGDFNGTLPVSINDLGLITGVYYDATNASHGFLRSPKGVFTTFDPPGAGSFGIIVHGMNLQGAVVGSYLDANSEYHGFLRSPNGVFTTFVAPSACSGGFDAGCNGTGAYDINLLGTIVGAYEDTSGNFVAHGYVRSPNGKFAQFAVPGSSMEAGQGTLPSATINLAGATTGLYYDANNAFHGFLRNSNGAFTTFEAPGADTTTEFNGTFPQSINDGGSITGYDLDVNEVFHGFLRSPKGSFVTFDVPGSDTAAGDFNGTLPASLNLFGRVAGYYYDANGASHGFLGIPCNGVQPCKADDQSAVSIRVSGVSSIQTPAKLNRVNPHISTVGPMRPFGGRLMPPYRGPGTQPTK